MGLGPFRAFGDCIGASSDLDHILVRCALRFLSSTSLVIYCAFSEEWVVGELRFVVGDLVCASPFYCPCFFCRGAPNGLAAF